MNKLTRSIALSATAALCLAFAAVAPAAAQTPAEPEATPPLRSLGGGGWSWFADPRAIYRKGRYERTYVGWIDRGGAVRLASYDHASRQRTTIVLRWRLGDDDHNNPALHVLPDGRLIVFYSGHGGPQMFYRVSSRPEDITRWEPERTIPTNTRSERGRSHYTYPNPVQLSAESNRLWLFWRGGTSWPTFSTSTDNGDTWSNARNLISYPGNRPYVKYASNGRDTIHFAFTQGHPATLNGNIYYARYRNGAVYRADGTRIASMDELPIGVREADKVYDGKATAWIHDVAHVRGRPIVVFATIDARGRHGYHYARWDGERWIRHSMGPAGGSIANDGKEPLYSGGITLDHENPSVVLLLRESRGTFEVERWRTPDGGESWRRERITNGSDTENVRPVSPRGMRSFSTEMSALWMRGNYRHYLSYKTDLTTVLLNGGNLPPVAEAAAGPRSGTAPHTVSFSARPSSDPDGQIVRRVWQFGDGTSAEGVQVEHRYSRPGTYFARLNVFDDSGDKDSYIVEIKVGNRTTATASSGG